MKIVKITRVLLTSLVLSLAFAGTGIGAEKEKDKERGEKSEGKLSAMDKAFIEMVALNDMTELKLAKAAQEKATNDQLKQHAAKMIEDHTKSSNELKQLAKQKDVDLKEELPAPKRAMIEEITSKSGADFDQAYMDHEIAGHRMAAVLFQNGSQFAKDQEVKQFADKYLPVIEQHRSMVEQHGQKTTQQPSAQPRGETAGTRGTQPSTSGQQQQPQQPSGQVRTE